MTNKTKVQRMIDFLESAPPIDMSSHSDCAAHQIAEQVFLDTVDNDFDRAVRVISVHADIPKIHLESIFMVATGQLWMEFIERKWVYNVEEAKDVTNQMVADQLRKYL